MAPWLRAQPRPGRRPATDDVVVADLLRELGRGDLIVEPDPV
jgi:hypothetical protein